MRHRKQLFWLPGFATLTLGGILDPAYAASSVHSSATPFDSPVHAPPIPAITTPNYRAIVERYGPAVVGLTIEDSSSATEKDNHHLLDDGEPPSMAPDAPQPGSRLPVQELGSGFIVSPDGLILTNAHVVSDATAITVTLDDRREFKASVLGLDPATDVAVLKVDAKNLPTVSLGDSDRIKVGDYVLAIGSPYGFEETATSGIVSALHRPLPESPFVPFIQTDAAVNPGNSGGPLFNASGEVVGINAQIYTHTGAFEGLSFAIPIDLAKHVADQIVATGQVAHGWLGVSVQQLTQPLADSFGLTKPDGALIASIKPHSPAVRAGLLPGDVILKCDKVPIRQAEDVSALIGLAKPDDLIVFTVWRDSKELEITAKLSRTDSAISEEEDASPAVENRLGLGVKVLSADERKVVNVSSGLIVVFSSGPAQKAGILQGDLLLAVNGTRIETIDQLRTVVSDGGSTIAILIQRGGERTYVPVALN